MPGEIDNPWWRKKTRPCPFYSQGKCYFKDACNFIHVAKAQVPPEILITVSRSIDDIDDSASSTKSSYEHSPTPPNPLSPESLEESQQAESPKQRDSWESIHSIVSAATNVTYPTDRSPTDSVGSEQETPSPLPEDEENTLTVYGDLAYSVGTRIILDPPKPRKTLTLPTNDNVDRQASFSMNSIQEESEDTDPPARTPVTRQLSLNTVLLNLQDPNLRPRREIIEGEEQSRQVVQRRPPAFVGGDRSSPAFRLHLSSLIANRTSLINASIQKKSSSPSKLPSMIEATEAEKEISPPRASSDPKRPLISLQPFDKSQLSPIPTSDNSASASTPRRNKHVFSPDGADAFTRPFRPARGKDRRRAKPPQPELSQKEEQDSPESSSPDEPELAPAIAMPVPPSPTGLPPSPPPLPQSTDSPGLLPIAQTPPLQPRPRSKSSSPSLAPAVIPPLRARSRSNSPSLAPFTSNTPPLRPRSRSRSKSPFTPVLSPIEPLRLRSTSKSPSPSPVVATPPLLPSPKLVESKTRRSPLPNTHERLTSRDLTESPENFLPQDRRGREVHAKREAEDEVDLLDKYFMATPERKPTFSKEDRREGETTVKKRTDTPPESIIEQPSPSKEPVPLRDSPQQIRSPASDTDDSELSAASSNASTSSKLRPLRLSILFQSNPQTPLKNPFFDTNPFSIVAGLSGSGTGDVRGSVSAKRRPLSALLDDGIVDDEPENWKGKEREMNLSTSPSKRSLRLPIDTPSNDTQLHNPRTRGTTSQPHTPPSTITPSQNSRASVAKDVKLSDGTYHPYYSHLDSPKGVLFGDRPRTIEEAASRMGSLVGLGISHSSSTPSLSNISEKDKSDTKRGSHRYSKSYTRQPTSATLPTIEGSPNHAPRTAPLSSSATFSPPGLSASLASHSRSSSIASNGTNTDRPLLFWALASDNIEEVERLLASGEASANDKAGPLDLPALVFAMENDGLKNRTEMVKMLLEYGADPAALANVSHNNGGGTSGEEADGEDGLKRSDSTSTVKAGRRPLRKRASTMRLDKLRKETVSSVASDSTVKNVPVVSNPAIEYYLTRKPDIPKGQLEALRKAGFDPLTRMPFHM
ncbi:hypothetical protein FRC02_008299 [Tulasnella sp. 418]|nr:hypothetical protein FRC02_008299 [Tulasnella sp. 418]